VQHSEGMNKFTSYRVDVRPPTVAPAEQPQEVLMHAPATFSAVMRRYSDFLWLYERLQIEKAGAIIPPLPEKQPVGRFDPNFIEDRRMFLERFLRRVAIHPELADAKCLDTFLRADDMTFSATKQAKGEIILASSTLNVAMKPKAENSFKRWFAEAKTSISGDLVQSPDDDLFEEIHRYVHGLDSQMKNVSQQASGLVRKGKEIANGLFEFGLAFNLLGQSEADALGDALGKVGETADRLSVLSADQAAKEMAQFEEPLQDYIKMIHSVKLALQRRHEKRLTYSTCLASVEYKQQALRKLRMQPGQEAKAYAAEMSLRRAHEAAQIAQDDFATVSQRVLREVDRFKREKAEEMRRTVLDYINLQVEYNKKMEEIWAGLIPQLERVQLDSNSNAIPQQVQNVIAPSQIMQPQVYATTGPQGYSSQFIADSVVNNEQSMMSVQYRNNM
jgi:sorting nexin-1/2